MLDTKEYSALLSNSPFCNDKKLSQLFGKCKFLDIHRYHSLKEILEYIEREKFTQIVFANPFSDTITEELYLHCKRIGLKFVVCERGALPDSIFHDQTGFLFDSSAYNREKWENTLTNDQGQKIQKYISSLTTGNNPLEKQPLRANKCQIYKTLNLRKDSLKIVFFLQTRRDTVLKKFGGKFKTLENVKDFAISLYKLAPQDTQIIFKNHPLENNPINIKGCIDAGNLHYQDLISLSDVVITVNSGTGLIAAAQKKKVFVLGDCWYHHEGIVKKIITPIQFWECYDLYKPSNNLINQFLYYLRYEFYSFGKQKTVLFKKNNIITNSTVAIYYYEIQFFNKYRKIYNLNYKNNIFILKYYICRLKQKLFKFRRNPKGFFKDMIDLNRFLL